MSRFRVSSDVFGRFHVLAGLDTATVRGLCDLIQAKLKVQLVPEEELQEIASSYEPLKEHTEEARASLCSSIIGLHVMRYGSAIEVDDLVEDLVNAADADDDFDGSLDQFRENLLCCLSIHAVQSSIKAWTLVEEYDRIFLDSRIISDIRPVFDDELSKPLRASLVVHTIKLTYRKENKREQIFLAGDSADLEALKEQIDRALEKGRALKSIIQGSHLFGASLSGEDDD